MVITKLVPDEEQQRKIKGELANYLYMLKEIYHYLQSKSKIAPWVDANLVRKTFIDDMKIGGNNLLTNASLHNIILETCVQGERARNEPPTRTKKLCRYQFIEIIIRFAVHLNTDYIL